MAARSIEELIALANKEPGKLNYASAGRGSGIHLGTELFASMADIRFPHIPYRGTSPALNDLVGGHVDVYFSSLPSALGLVSEGKVRALAVTGAAREKVLPDVPTVAEAGLPGYEAVLHYGIIAPAGMPQPIIEKLNSPLRDARPHRRDTHTAGHRWRRADAQHARGLRRRHRPRGDQVVADRAAIGAKANSGYRITSTSLPRKSASG